MNHRQRTWNCCRCLFPFFLFFVYYANAKNGTHLVESAKSNTSVCNVYNSWKAINPWVIYQYLTYCDRINYTSLPARIYNKTLFQNNKCSYITESEVTNILQKAVTKGEISSFLLPLREDIKNRILSVIPLVAGPEMFSLSRPIREGLEDGTTKPHQVKDEGLRLTALDIVKFGRLRRCYTRMRDPRFSMTERQKYKFQFNTLARSLGCKYSIARKYGVRLKDVKKKPDCLVQLVRRNGVPGSLKLNHSNTYVQLRNKLLRPGFLDMFAELELTSILPYDEIPRLNKYPFVLIDLRSYSLQWTDILSKSISETDNKQHTHQSQNVSFDDTTNIISATEKPMTVANLSQISNKQASQFKQFVDMQRYATVSVIVPIPYRLGFLGVSPFRALVFRRELIEIRNGFLHLSDDIPKQRFTPNDLAEISTQLIDNFRNYAILVENQTNEPLSSEEVPMKKLPIVKEYAIEDHHVTNTRATVSGKEFVQQTPNRFTSISRYCSDIYRHKVSLLLRILKELQEDLFTLQERKAQQLSYLNYLFQGLLYLNVSSTDHHRSQPNEVTNTSMAHESETIVNRVKTTRNDHSGRQQTIQQEASSPRTASIQSSKLPVVNFVSKYQNDMNLLEYMRQYQLYELTKCGHELFRSTPDDVKKQLEQRKWDPRTDRPTRQLGSFIVTHISPDSIGIKFYTVLLLENESEAKKLTQLMAISAKSHDDVTSLNDFLVKADKISKFT